MLNLPKEIISSGTYLAGAVFIGMVIGIFTYRWLRKTELRKKISLKQRDFEEPIEPDNSPLPDSDSTAKRRGLRSIENRFRLIRRFLIPLFIFIWGLIAVIPTLSVVSSVYVSLLVGAITVIVGMAAKPWIENFIAGLVISLGQSVRVGDTVEIDEQYGIVEEITLTYCVVKVWDWRRYIIPNQRMIQKEFINYTIKDSFVWKKVEFWVSADADLHEVERLSVAAMNESESLVSDEAPSFWIMGVEKDAVRCWIAGWAESPAQAWTLSHETRRSIVHKLQAAGIRLHRFDHRIEPGSEAPKNASI